MRDTKDTQNVIEKLTALGADTPETRSRRIQVLLTPTMHDTLKALAEKTGVSVNGIINAALSEFISQGEK